jgi:hypothetical protein
MNSSNSQCTNIVPTPKKTFTTKDTKITKNQQSIKGLRVLRGELLSTFRIADE